MSQKKPQRSKILNFSSGTERVITQDQLIEERILFQKATRAVEKWQEQVRSIRRSIESGAKVEPGIYKAAIVEEEWEDARGLKSIIERLVVS